MSVFVHADRRIKVNDPEALTLVMMENAQQVNEPMTEDAAKRMNPVMQPVASDPHLLLIGGGVPERFPDYLAHRVQRLLARLAVGSMDKCWITGIGQDPDWWIGVWDENKPDNDQPGMAQLFSLNEKWQYPLMPSEYVQRQFHVSFQDDPVAVACRHITGLSTVMWGNDYPPPRAPFAAARTTAAANGRRTRDERKAMVGGTWPGSSGSGPVSA
jgi:hypothetical protein